MSIYQKICIGMVFTLQYVSCVHFFSIDFLQKKSENPAVINQASNEEEKQMSGIFSLLPKEVQQEVGRVREEIKKCPIDTREWYQKKRYWALIVASTVCGGAAGGCGAAKLIALANVSQATVAVVTVAASTTAGVASGVAAIYVISECKGYEIKFVENGVYIVKKNAKKS